MIKPNQALRLRARRETKDCDGIIRKDGEEWLVRREGAYLPGVYEEVVSIVKAYILTDSRALGLRAIKTFTDRFNKNRKVCLMLLSNASSFLIFFFFISFYLLGWRRVDHHHCRVRVSHSRHLRRGHRRDQDHHPHKPPILLRP